METPGPNDPQSLDDFKGTKAEVIKAKSDYITKFGRPAYEKLVQKSSIHVKK